MAGIDQYIAPVHLDAVLSDQEIALMREFGEHVRTNELWTQLAVNAFPAISLQAGILAANLNGAHSHQISFEVNTKHPDVDPETALAVGHLAHTLTDLGEYQVMGFNYYLGSGERIEQPPHRDRGLAEVFSLAGEGGVTIFPAGDRLAYDIFCKPGDWAKAGTELHAGFGIASDTNPRISAYFYTPPAE